MILVLDHSITLLLGPGYYYFPYLHPIKRLTKAGLDERKGELWDEMRLAFNVYGELPSQSSAPVMVLTVISNIRQAVNQIVEKLNHPQFGFPVTPSIKLFRTSVYAYTILHPKC